jgi:hypothetical protein
VPNDGNAHPTHTAADVADESVTLLDDGGRKHAFTYTDGSSESNTYYDDGSRTEESISATDGTKIIRQYGSDGSMQFESHVNGGTKTFTYPDGNYREIHEEPDGLERSTTVGGGAETIHSYESGSGGASTGSQSFIREDRAGGVPQFVSRIETPGQSLEVIPLQHSDTPNHDGTATRAFTYPDGRVDSVRYEIVSGKVLDYDSTPPPPGTPPPTVVTAHWSTGQTDGEPVPSAPVEQKVQLAPMPDGRLGATYTDADVHQRSIVRDPATGITTYSTDGQVSYQEDAAGNRIDHEVAS